MNKPQLKVTTEALRPQHNCYPFFQRGIKRRKKLRQRLNVNANVGQKRNGDQ